MKDSVSVIINIIDVTGIIIIVFLQPNNNLHFCECLHVTCPGKEKREFEKA